MSTSCTTTVAVSRLLLRKRLLVRGLVVRSNYSCLAATTTTTTTLQPRPSLSLSSSSRQQQRTATVVFQYHTQPTRLEFPAISGASAESPSLITSSWNVNPADAMAQAGSVQPNESSSSAAAASQTRNFSTAASSYKEEDEFDEDENVDFTEEDNTFDYAGFMAQQTGPLWERYKVLVREKDIQPDLHQLESLMQLERLRQDLIAMSPVDIQKRVQQHHHDSSSSSSSAQSSADQHQPSNSSSSSSGFFSSWFGGGSTSSTTSTKTSETAKSKVPSSLHVAITNPAPVGVYLHGGVGCGKTFLMNLFYDSLADDPATAAWNAQKQKVHFHKFMLQRVHEEMHQARRQRKNPGQKHLEHFLDGSFNAANVKDSNEQDASDSLLPAVIEKCLSHGRLLCLDEFQVTDVADALILQRLFTGLWKEGCILVATSNRPPDQLYWNGLQRDRFLPFIALLKQQCHVQSMEESDTDYRLVQKAMSTAAQAAAAAEPTQDSNAEQPSQKVYFAGGKQARQEFDALFWKLVGNHSAVAPMSLTTQGRQVKIPQASMKRCIARFAFEDVCTKAAGAADYLIIGQQFHTVFVEGIPILTMNELNWVRRFITFVDAMYECNVKLILHAKTLPADIFQRPADDTSHDEVFAFDRTVSRLEEMSSPRYLQRKKWAGQAHAIEDSKAAILSQSRATLSVIPSLSDSKQRHTAATTATA